MKCAICRNGTTDDGYITVTLERHQTTFIFKRVPAHVCDNCGEEYVSAETNKTLLQKAETMLENGVTLEMLNFAA